MPYFIYDMTYIIWLYYEGKGCGALAFALIPMDAAQDGLVHRVLCSRKLWLY